MKIEKNIILNQSKDTLRMVSYLDCVSSYSTYVKYMYIYISLYLTVCLFDCLFVFFAGLYKNFSLFFYVPVFLSVHFFDWLSYYAFMFICLPRSSLFVNHFAPMENLSLLKYRLSENARALMTNILCWTGLYSRIFISR